MISKRTDNTFVDEAWDRLYKRFQEEGLLPTETTSKKASLYPYKLKWVASFAILCICIASFIIWNMNSTSKEFLTLQNENSSSTLVTTLYDNSIVYLYDYTSLEYPKDFDKEKREVTLKGEAFFEISKNKEQPFIINTEAATIEVLGTAFNVKVLNKSSFSLSVKNGEVKVTSKNNNQELHIKAGETVSMESGYLHLKKSSGKWLFDKYLKHIHFKDETLNNIIRVINLNSDSVKLKVSPQIKERKLNITFGKDTPAAIAEIIGLALDLQVLQENNIITLSEK